MGILSLFKRNQDASSPARAKPQRYRRGLFSVFGAGEDLYLVRCGGETRLVPVFVIDFVWSCLDFAGMETHLSRYAEDHEIDPAQMEAIKSWLPALEEIDCLLSERKLQERCSRIPRQERELEPVHAIGFPTGNRVEILERALLSFIENTKRHGREVNYIVTDSSLDAEVRGRYRQELTRLAKEHGVNIEYIGLEEKERFVRVLAVESGVELETVEFALLDPENCGFACGANRNALLLHEAGHLFVAVDDDMVCNIAAAPGMRETLAFSSMKDPSERWFFEDRETLLRETRYEDHDFLGIHERFLGKPLGWCMTGYAENADADFSDIDDTLLKRLLGGEGRIRVTACGHAGDPGIPTSCGYMGYRGETFRRLTQDESFYRKVLNSRNVHCMVENPHVGDMFFCPGMAMGLDHGELLPPFFPVLHAEDAVFGAAVWHCWKDAYLAHLPYALYHDPGPRTIFHPDEFSAEGGFLMFEFSFMMRAFINGCERGNISGEDRMIRLGRALEEIGQIGRSAFEEMARGYAIQHASGVLSFLEQRLKQEEEGPDYWKEDVRRYMEKLQKVAVGGGYGVTRDLKLKYDDETALGLMQRLVGRYGRLLQAWPRMVAAAKVLRDRGEALAVKL